MISFMSEHTAEYALVGNLVSILKSEFPNVIPLYIWLNREGDTVGRESFKGKQPKLVAVFPRRPKVSFSGDTHILVKFNSSILRHAFHARSFGIPVIAGVPLVSDLSSFRIDSKCLWFILNGSKSGNRDLEITLSDRGELTHHLGAVNTVRGPVNAGDLLRDINNVAKEDTWESWLKIVREIRTRQGPTRFFWFQATYKPFYLVIL